MSCHRFCRRYTHVVCLLTKYILKSLCFHKVIKMCRCTVSININLLITCNTSFLSCHRDSSYSTLSFWIWSCDVVSICCVTITNNFCIDMSTTLNCSLILFKDNNCATFTHNETMSSVIEWNRCSILIF